MTKEELMAMACESGTLCCDELQHFADLVAAKEREACIATVTEMRNTADIMMEDLDQIGRVLSDRMEAFEDVIEQLQARGNK